VGKPVYTTYIRAYPKLQYKLEGKTGKGWEDILTFFYGSGISEAIEHIQQVTGRKIPKAPLEEKAKKKGRRFDQPWALFTTRTIDTHETTTAIVIRAVTKEPKPAEGKPDDILAYREGPGAETADLFFWQEDKWQSVRFTRPEKAVSVPSLKPDYAVPAPTSIVVFGKDGDFSYKDQCELFSLIGPGAQPEEVMNGEGKSLLRYDKGKWIVDFDQELLEREIKGDASHRFPTLSQMEWRVWVSTLWLARQNPSNIGADTIWAVFSGTDMLKCLGKDLEKVGGKDYGDVRRAIANLIAAKPGIKHEDGDRIRLAVFPYYIYSQLEIDKRTGTVLYRLQINPNTGDATSRWVRRRLQVEGGQAEIEWITYPMGQIQDSPPKAKARIRNELLRLPDDRWSYPVGLPTIAKNWAGIPERELRKPKQLKRKMEQIFDELKDEGILEDYKPEIARLKMMDKRTGKVFWKYRFKRKRKIRPDSEKVTEVVERLVEWHLKPEFKIRKSREELETMLTTTVNKYGAEENELLLEAAIEEGYPPDWYWSQIKEGKFMDSVEHDLGHGRHGSNQEPEKPQPQEKPEEPKRLTPEEIKAQLDRLEGDGKLNNSARQLLEIALRQSPHQNVIDETLEGLG